MDWLRAIAFARRLIEEVAEGRLELVDIKNMTDEELAAFDGEAFQGLQDAQNRNEQLAADDS